MNTFFRSFTSGGGATDTNTGPTESSTGMEHTKIEEPGSTKNLTSDGDSSSLYKNNSGDQQNNDGVNLVGNNTEISSHEKSLPGSTNANSLSGATENGTYSYSEQVLNNGRTGDENEDHSNMSVNDSNTASTTLVGDYNFGMGNILNGGNGNNGESTSSSNSVSVSHPQSLSSSPNSGDILNQPFNMKNASLQQHKNEDELRKSVLSEIPDLERHGISLRESTHSGAHSAIPLSTNFYSTPSSSSNNNSAKSSPPIYLPNERMTRDDNHLFYPSASSLSGSYPQFSSVGGTTGSNVTMNKEVNDNSSANGNEVGPSTKATSEASSITSTNYIDTIWNMGGVGDSFMKSNSSSLQGRSPSPTLGDSQNTNTSTGSVNKTGVQISISNNSNTNTAPLTKSISSPTRPYSTPLTNLNSNDGSTQPPSFHPSASTNNIVNIMEDPQFGNVMTYSGNGTGGNAMSFPLGMNDNTMAIPSYSGNNNQNGSLNNGHNMSSGSQRSAAGQNYNHTNASSGYSDFNFVDNSGGKPYFDFQAQQMLQHGGNPTTALPNQSLDMLNWNLLNAIQGNANNGNGNNIYPNGNVGNLQNGRYPMNNGNPDFNHMMHNNNNNNNGNATNLSNNPNQGKNGPQNLNNTPHNGGNNPSNAQTQTLLMLQALQNSPGLNQYTVNQLQNQLNLLQQQQQQQHQPQQRSGMNQSGNGNSNSSSQQPNFAPNNSNIGNNTFDSNNHNLSGANGYNMAANMNGNFFNDLSTLNTLLRFQSLNLGPNSVPMNGMNNGMNGNGNQSGQNLNNTNKGGRGRGPMMGNNYNGMNKAQNGNYGKGMNNSSNVGGLGSTAHNSNPNMNSTASSEILEEFRSNSKNKVWDIKDITGHIVEFCQDQHGSRFIQQQLETASDEDKQVIFREVLPCASTLMTDVFGNYVVQKILEHGSQEQREKMAQLLKGTAVELALQMYGCRVIQKALEVIGKQLLEELVSEFRGHVLKCVHDQNGNHVIQKCIEVLSMRARESQDDEEYLTDQVDFIVKSFKGQVERFSTHPYGCRVIQRILEHCTPAQKDIILQEIRLCSKSGLVQDQYGNYVIQHVMKHADVDDRAMVINEIKGKLLSYSQHKFASNVVEKCLQFGNRQERNAIVDEVVSSVMLGDNLLQVMVRDPFGNYVVQKILDIADDQQQEAICTYLRSHATQLKKYTYGKHILVRLEKISGEKIF